MNAYALYAVNVATVADTVLIDQVTDLSYENELVEALLSGDGAVDPAFLALASQQIRLNFTTSMLKSVLDENSNGFLIDGIPIAADESHDGIEFWFQKFAEGATRASGGVHQKMTVKKGILIPTGLTARQGETAMLALQALATYDGTNNPVVLATAALEGTPTLDEAYTLGPCNINGSALDNVQSVQIAPNITPALLSGDGAVWAKFVAIGERKPLITIMTTNAAVLGTYGLVGTAIGASDVQIFLRKRTEGAALLADATAEHIKITVYDGMVSTRRINAQGSTPAMVELTVRPRKGASAIMAVDTASAVS